MNVKQAYELTMENRLKITLDKLDKAIEGGKTSLILYEQDFPISSKFVAGLREDGFKCVYVEGDREGGEDDHLIITWDIIQVRAYEEKLEKEKDVEEPESQEQYFIGVDWAEGEEVQTYCLFKVVGKTTLILELDSIAKDRTLFRNTISRLVSEYNAELIYTENLRVQSGRLSSGTSTQDIPRNNTMENEST